jgi:hypothetical protein
MQRRRSVRLRSVELSGERDVALATIVSAVEVIDRITEKTSRELLEK